jgi:Helix-turn-helix domain
MSLPITFVLSDEQLDTIAQLAATKLLATATPSKQEKYLNQREAAEYLNIGINTLKSYVAKGLLRQVPNHGKRMARYAQSELDRFMSPPSPKEQKPRRW